MSALARFGSFSFRALRQRLSAQSSRQLQPTPVNISSVARTTLSQRPISTASAVPKGRSSTLSPLTLGRRLVLASALGGCAIWQCTTSPLGGAFATAAVRCDELAPKVASAGVAGVSDKPAAEKAESALQRLAGGLQGACALSLLILVWAVSLTMPGVLGWALYTARWRLVAGLILAYAFPHIVPIPHTGAVRKPITSAMERWFGGPGSLRVVALDQSLLEPEPEPATAGDRKRLLYGLHPHGIYTFSSLLLLNERPEVRLLTSPFLYNCAPLLRIVLEGLMGYNIGSVGRSELGRQMKAGDGPLALVPGGFHEATIACSGTERVYIKNRKGFVKYALRHGYSLVPCYLLGESDTMSNAQGFWSFRFFLNDLSLPAVLIWGYPLFPLFPRRDVPLVLGIGAPVHLPKIEKPSKADVDEYHQRYVEGLIEVYNKIKPGTSSEARPLEVW